MTRDPGFSITSANRLLLVPLGMKDALSGRIARGRGVGLQIFGYGSMPAYNTNLTCNKNLAIANRSRVSCINTNCSHNLATSRESKTHFGLPWVRPWDNRGKC